MAFTPVDNSARFELVFTHNGVPCENVFHLFSAITSWTSTDLADSCLNFKTWWAANLESLVSTETTLVKIIATALHEQTSPKIEYVTGLPLAGTGLSAAMPGNVTLAVKWTSGNRGRSARGRTYHIGLMEDQVTGNQLDESVYTDMLTAYEALMPVVNVSSKSLRILSLWHDGVKRDAGLMTPVTGVAIEPTIDTQRRRLLV